MNNQSASYLLTETFHDEEDNKQATYAVVSCPPPWDPVQ